MLLRQLQQQRLLRREVRQRQPLRALQPAVAVGLAALVALDVEMLAEHLQLALDGAQVTLQARVLELLVQLPGGDLAPTRNAAQQLYGQQGGFQGVGAAGHCGRSNG